VSRRHITNGSQAVPNSLKPFRDRPVVGRLRKIGDQVGVRQPCDAEKARRVENRVVDLVAIQMLARKESRVRAGDAPSRWDCVESVGPAGIVQATAGRVVRGHIPVGQVRRQGVERRVLVMHVRVEYALCSDLSTLSGVTLQLDRRTSKMRSDVIADPVYQLSPGHAIGANPQDG
jgi:hypothetical protein